MRFHRSLTTLLCGMLLSCLGCGGSDKATTSTEPFVLGDLVDDFTPPTLEELNAQVTWKDMPVLEGMELMREKQAGEKPLVTVEEALALKNDSPEANEKILSTLGQPPGSAADVDYDASHEHSIPRKLRISNSERGRTSAYPCGISRFRIHPCGLRDSGRSRLVAVDR